MVREVLSVIPIVRTEVEPTDERDATVDHDKLLMVAGADGVVVIETKLDSALRAFLKPPPLEPFPFVRIVDGKVPGQHVDAQLGVVVAKLLEERQEKNVAARFLGV